MLQSKKDKLTVGILTRLKQRGPPRNEIANQSLIGEEEVVGMSEPELPEDEQETMNDIATTNSATDLPPGLPRRRPARKGVPPGVG